MLNLFLELLDFYYCLEIGSCLHRNDSLLCELFSNNIINPLFKKNKSYQKNIIAINALLKYLPTFSLTDAKNHGLTTEKSVFVYVCKNQDKMIQILTKIKYSEKFQS